MKFIDQAKISILAGNGGNGIISFRREANVDRGGPDGGDGGNGGNIYFQGDNGMNTLLPFHYQTKYKAQNGENGKTKNAYGANGNDLIIKVPIGTMIINEVNNDLLADIIDEKLYLVAKGGIGGKGNTKFKSSRNTAPRICENGTKGQQYDLILNLKVLADIGFIGKPCAGKSSLLSKISNAKPKIADYDFTTLVPQLGLVNYKDYSYVVADLPGLIEFASKGKGLGTQFLKHIERCKVIAHIIDFGNENKDPITDYLIINKELKSYNLFLEKLPQIVIANKSDLEFFYKNLKNELNRRKVRYKIEENSEEWVIVLLDVPYFEGKVVKLQNRSEFLEKGKGQYIDVPSKLYLTDPPSQAVEGVAGGLMGAVAVPVMVVLAIPALVVLPFLIPFMKIGNTP